jgi:N4-gp56 family major capsid protein
MADESTAGGTLGVAWAGTPNAMFGEVVTALVVRNLIDRLRDSAIFLQEGSYIRARQVPGTNQMVFTAFADLTAAETLLEGTPPEPDGLKFDTFNFTGVQKGKVVGITDIASLLSPFELYSQAAEKVAWNALDTAEKDIATALQASAGVVVTPGTGAVETLVAAVVALKQGDVPTFPDGYYRCFASPATTAAFMTQAGELGWTDTMKYASSMALLNGEMGKFRGVRFIETNRVADATSVITGPDAYAWGDYQTIQAYRVAPGGDHSDPLAQKGLVGWKGMWGVKVVEFPGAAGQEVGPASNPKGFRHATLDLVP